MNPSKTMAGFALAVAASSCLAQSGVENDLATYARALETSTPERAIRFRGVERTGGNTFRVSFTTSSPSLMSLPNAKEDKAAFAANLGRTKVWETKSCTAELSTVLKRYNLIMVAFVLENRKGEPQSIALCLKNSGESKPSVPPSRTIGSWYDDVGSPSYLNATFTIRVEGGKTWLTRLNGDGSKGEYELAPAGDTYVKVGDKHGAYYVITPAGLRTNDRQGYIRTAKPK